jgi:hypothetical protein
VAFRVAKLLERIEEGAAGLYEALRASLPTCIVQLDSSTLEISVSLPSGKMVTLHNRGVDALNSWLVYEIGTKSSTVFLHTPANFWNRSSQPRDWCWTLWRGKFAENRNLGQFQNYPNKLEESLLLEAFAPWS